MNLNRYRGLGLMSPLGKGYALQRLTGGYTTDATSGINIPQTPPEWVHFQTAKNTKIGLPNLLYTCKEPNGSMIASVGTMPLAPHVATGGPQYQHAVAGWSAKAIVTGNTANYFSSTDARLPDVSARSIASLILIDLSAPTLALNNFPDFLTWGSPTDNSAGSLRLAMYSNTGQWLVANKATSATATISVIGRGVVPFFVQHDVTNQVCFACTDKELLTPGFVALTSGKFHSLGPSGSYAPFTAFPTLLVAHWFDEAAENATADAHALLAGMNWTMGW